MGHHLTLLSLIVSSAYLSPAAGFAPVCTGMRTSISDFKHARNSGYHAPSGRRPPATGSGPESRARVSPAAAWTWPSRARRRNASGSRRPVHTWATAAAATEVEDATYEPESSPGLPLAPDNPRVLAFEEWAAEAGCRGGASLSHADFEGLRGLMTRNAVDPWQPVATVPASLLLQEHATWTPAATPGESGSRRPPAPLSIEAWQRCPWWVRLGVRLLEEKSSGQCSRLREYVGILPEEGGTGTPLHWSEEQLDRLHYPRLLSQVALQRRIFTGFQKFLLADVERANTAQGAEGGDRALVDALKDTAAFSWALECVLSRAFQLPPDNAAAMVLEQDDDVPVRAPAVEPSAPQDARMALLPFIDSMNHYSRMPTHMYWEADGAISFAVGAPLDPGDHVFLSYGPVSNDDLLQYYGFVERDNPSDTYVLQDMGRWLREDGLLGADMSSKFLACPGAREAWRYLRRGVILRDAVHPNTMQAVRVVCCERASNSSEGVPDTESRRWDGTEADLARFGTPVSLVSEVSAFDLLMRYSAREADAWGEAGVAAALAEDPTAPGLDGDLDGLGLDTDRRLMLSVFRQEKLALLRGIVSRLTHMRKVSDLLNRPIKMPVVNSPPPVLGTFKT